MPPTDLLLEMLLYAGLLPGGVALLVLGVPVWRRPELSEPAVRRLGALALAGGFVAGYVALEWPPPRSTDFRAWWAWLSTAPLPPTEPWRWLPWLAVLAGVVAALPGVPRAALWLGVAALAAWLLFVPGEEWEPLRQRCYLAVGGGVAALGLLMPIARRQPGPGLPLLLTLAALAGAVVLERSSNARLAQLAGVLTAVLTAGVLVARSLPQRPVAVGLAPGVAVLLPGLMAEGYFYTFSDVPLTSFALVAAAPLAAGLTLLPGLRALPGPARTGIRAVAVLLPLGVAVALAAQAAEAG